MSDVFGFSFLFISLIQRAIAVNTDILHCQSFTLSTVKSYSDDCDSDKNTSHTSTFQNMNISRTENILWCFFVCWIIYPSIHCNTLRCQTTCPGHISAIVSLRFSSQWSTLVELDMHQNQNWFWSFGVVVLVCDRFGFDIALVSI